MYIGTYIHIFLCIYVCKIAIACILNTCQFNTYICTYLRPLHIIPFEQIWYGHVPRPSVRGVICTVTWGWLSQTTLKGGMYETVLLSNNGLHLYNNKLVCQKQVELMRKGRAGFIK